MSSGEEAMAGGRFPMIRWCTNDSLISPEYLSCQPSSLLAHNPLTDQCLPTTFELTLPVRQKKIEFSLIKVIFWQYMQSKSCFIINYSENFIYIANKVVRFAYIWIFGGESYVRGRERSPRPHVAMVTTQPTYRNGEESWIINGLATSIGFLSNYNKWGE